VERDQTGALRTGLEGTRRITRKEWGISWNTPLDSGGVLSATKSRSNLNYRSSNANPRTDPEKLVMPQERWLLRCDARCFDLECGVMDRDIKVLADAVLDCFELLCGMTARKALIVDNNVGRQDR